MITARNGLRWTCAFLAFNVYSLFILSAFEQNTAYIFDAKLASEMIAAGKLTSANALGWNGHYIWYIFSSVVVTLLTGFLAGAIARSRGALVATVSNVAVWALMLYVQSFGEGGIDEATFKVASWIGIPLTTLLAYVGGKVGEEIQAKTFPDNTVLGIWPYHWIWAWLPLYVFGLGSVPDITRFAIFQVTTLSQSKYLDAMIYLLALVPVIAWVYPLVFIHKVLSGKIFSGRTVTFKFFLNTGAFIAGAIVATGIQIACNWLLGKLL